MKSNRQWFVLVFCLVLIPAFAQVNIGTTNPQTAALTAKSLSLLSGGQRIDDVALTGTVRRVVGSDDESGTAVIKGLASGESRVDFSFPSGLRSEMRTTSEKGSAGTWSGPDGVAHTMAAHNLLTEDSVWFSPVLMLSRITANTNISMSYAGTTTNDRGSEEHLSVSRKFPVHLPTHAEKLLQSAGKMELYFDSSTVLLSRVQFVTHPDNDMRIDIPVEIRFSDYRPVNGAQVPFHIQKYFNRNLILDLRLETAAANTGLTASSISAQ
jgi:hypothetical protein